jgi:processing peptidase subunit alpha
VRAVVASRGVSTSASLQQALPAVATEPKSKGWLSGLFGGGGSRINVPLTDALPGLVLPEHQAPPTTAPKSELTTLSNGFMVSSENTPVGTQTDGVLPCGA